MILKSQKCQQQINMDLGEDPYVLIFTSVVTLVCNAKGHVQCQESISHRFMTFSLKDNLLMI